MCSPQQINHAEGVRALYIKVKLHGVQQHREFLDDNIILNCPHKSDDEIVTEEMFSNDLGAIRGHALRQKTTLTQTISTIKVPDALKSIHHNFHLLMYVFFVNDVPFLLTMSENVGLIKAELMPDRTDDFMIDATQSIIKTCNQNDFEVTSIDTDI